MQDQHAGNAGTFIVDPEKGVRVPIEEYEAEQAANVKQANADKKQLKQIIERSE